MAKEDAPNYRKAEDQAKSCGTCAAWEDNGDGTGYCKIYDFDCRGTWTCDSWAAKGKSEGFINEIGNLLTDDPDIFNES